MNRQFNMLEEKLILEKNIFFSIGSPIENVFSNIILLKIIIISVMSADKKQLSIQSYLASIKSGSMCCCC